MTADAAEKKRRLREEIRRRLRALGADAFRSRGAAAVARLEEVPEVRSARTLVLFRALAFEVDTTPLARRAWADDRQTFFPRVEGEALDFVMADADTPWRPGERGTLEPQSDRSLVPDDLAGPVVIVVPGLAFTPEGWRLGRSGGYYDRALAGPLLAHPAFAIGLCVEEQVVDAVPVETHDQRLDMVVTDERVLRARRLAKVPKR